MAKKGAKAPTAEELAAAEEEEERLRVEAEAAAAAEEKRLAEEVKLKAERDKLQENLDRVKFNRTPAKHIVSPHSGSILAGPGPVVPLDKDLANKAMDVFSEYLTEAAATSKEQDGDGGGDEVRSMRNDECIEKHALAEVVKRCGFDILPDIVDATVTKMYEGGPEQVTLERFLQFLSKFQAPAFYYGQRLRKNAGRNQIEEMLELLARKCDVNTADGEGLTSLHYCCQFNRPDVMRAIIEAVGAERLAINAQDKYGWTPLHTAVHHGNDNCVAILLEWGVNVNIADRHGKPALHFACAQGRETILQRLVKAGADVSLVDNLGMGCAHEAAYRGHRSMYDALSENKSCIEVIEAAVDILGYKSGEYNQEEFTTAPQSAH